MDKTKKSESADKQRFPAPPRIQTAAGNYLLRLVVSDFERGFGTMNREEWKAALLTVRGMEVYHFDEGRVVGKAHTLTFHKDRALSDMEIPIGLHATSACALLSETRCIALLISRMEQSALTDIVLVAWMEALIAASELDGSTRIVGVAASYEDAADAVVRVLRRKSKPVGRF